MNWSSFEKSVVERMTQEHIPGLVVAVSQNGEIIYEKGFGIRDFTTKKPATPETIFGTASVTKSFTALAIMQLAEAGKLSVHDSVSKYLPSFRIQGVDPIEDIKIHHLLTHTTGLAPIERHESFNLFHDHLVYLREEKHDLLGKPGQYFSYSNDAFLLLGAIIEKVTGRLYRRYVTEEILYPLGMARATFSIEELSKMCNVSVPYIFNKEEDRFDMQNWSSLGNYEVGGGIRSSARDLLKYGELFINGGKMDKTRLIGEAYLQTIYKPYVQIDARTYYGYAFKVTPDYYGTTLVEHSGGQPGVSSNFGFLPEHYCSIAVLTNVSGASARDIWFEAANTLLNIPIETRVNPFPEKATRPKSIDVERFLGEFSSHEGDQLLITQTQRTLVAHYNDEQIELSVHDANHLIMIDTRKPIRFYFDAKDKAWAVFVGTRMLLKRNE